MRPDEQETVIKAVEFMDWLVEQYGPRSRVKLLDDGRYILAHPLLFHWTMIVGRIGDTWGFDTRYCYADEALALAALSKWDGNGDPEGWHRHPDTSRRRPDGDPALEYIEG